MEKDMEGAGGGRVIYTREELAENVRVPAVVEQDIKRIISERLEACGLYFRVFSRTKTAASMARKFERKDYGQDRKLQDLVGARINLYFDDDVDICKKIMERTFDLLEWSTSERSDEEFKPIKLNGVFRMPEYLRKEISAQTWDMCIDDTFEIQIKTMFFEGWHEIEHDMRYKGEELWDQFPSFSRYFNSILATLELCDKSMVTLFEDMGHALYKSGPWTDMIRCHFRLKLEETEMYPELEEVLNEDQGKNDALGKRIFKTDKRALVEILQTLPRRIPINVNTIAAVLNDHIFRDERLAAIFRERDVYNDGREEFVAESRHYELQPLYRNLVFQMQAHVDGNRMREVEKPSADDIFKKAAGGIYSWIRAKYGALFADMPAQPGDYTRQIMAYYVTIKIDGASRMLKMHVRHMDLDVGGRIWFSEARLDPDEKGRIILRACNGYAEPRRDSPAPGTGGLFFSYPGFYKTVVDTVGIRSGISCFNRRRILRSDQIAELAGAIRDRGRAFPVMLIISKEDADNMMDESWLGAFRVSDFIRTVWRYAHVFTCYEETGRVLMRLTGVERSRWVVPGFYIFWPDGHTDIYTQDDLGSCSFGRHLGARGDLRTYAIMYGGQAFYHKIVTDLRSYNVSAGLWEGFKLETEAAMPE